MATTFEVLAEPRRREILDLLRGGERPVGELVDHLALSQPAVSKHLKVLREAGLVAEQKVGRNVLYRVEPDGLAPLIDWMAVYAVFWRDKFDRLENLLDRMD